MRHLTHQEIDNAPEWATEYAIIKEQVVMIGGGQITKPEDEKILWSDIFETDFQPIPRKEFDISEYDWSDERAVFNVDVDAETVMFDLNGHGLELSEQDSVALAQHFGHYKESK